MRILGIDPAIGAKGAAPVGLAIIDTGARALDVCSTLRFCADDTTQQRLQAIAREMQRMIVQHPRIDIVAIEDAHYTRNVQTTKELSYVVGAALLAAGDIPALVVQPTAGKLALTGVGRADKAQMVLLAQGAWGLPEGLRRAEREAVADAIGAALAGEALARQQILERKAGRSK
jgi:Holliday junction resolvasome RuvABC endonuclease subunit